MTICPLLSVFSNTMNQAKVLIKKDHSKTLCVSNFVSIFHFKALSEITTLTKV